MRLLEHLHIVEILREAEDERHSVLFGSTTMILAKAFGGSSGRRESVSSDADELGDEDEDTVEMPPLLRHWLATT